MARLVSKSSASYDLATLVTLSFLSDCIAYLIATPVSTWLMLMLGTAGMSSFFKAGSLFKGDVYLSSVYIGFGVIPIGSRATSSFGDAANFSEK